MYQEKARKNKQKMKKEELTSMESYYGSNTVQGAFATLFNPLKSLRDKEVGLFSFPYGKIKACYKNSDQRTVTDPRMGIKQFIEGKHSENRKKDQQIAGRRMDKRKGHFRKKDEPEYTQKKK